MAHNQPLAPREGSSTFGNYSRVQFQRRTRSSLACDTCRSQRRKCDGATPCTRCRENEIECVYSGPDGRKKEALKAQIAALEDRNAYLEELVERLGRNSSGEAMSGSPCFVQRSAQNDREKYVGSSETPTVSHDQTPYGEKPELQHMIRAATSRPVPWSPESYWQHGRQHGYRGGNLPEEHITRRALDAFFECAATSFYVTTVDQAARLIEKVYHSYHASPEDICELCALATIGSHYLGLEIPDNAREAYFYLASTSLDETLQAGTIQGLRIFICLWMSSIMDTSYSARLLIISALNLARGKIDADSQKATLVEHNKDEYKRTLQTLVFLKGWLSYSLGHRSCLSESELDLIHYTVPLELTSAGSDAHTTRLVQTQMTKLALLGSKARDELPLNMQGYWDLAERFLAKMDTWHRELPSNLQLAALNSEQHQVGLLQEKSLYIMHMLYMDMRIQLYCQIIKDFYRAVPETRSRCSKLLFSQVPLHLSGTHEQFAIQIVRVTSILYERSAITTRCWLVIRAVFDACVLLLLSSCMRYNTNGEDSSRGTDVFAHVNAALTVLDFCGRSDIAARRLRDMLEPVIKGLSRMGLASALEQGNGSHADKMEIEHIITQSPEQDMSLIYMVEELLSYISPTKNIWI